MLKIFVFFMSSLFMFSLYQSCGELKSRDSFKISSISDDSANVDFLVNEDQEDVLLRVPNDLIESASVSEGFNWVFVDEDGEEYPLDNNSSTLHLSDLNMDLDLLASGFFRVRFVSQSVVQMIILKIIVQGKDSDQPINPIVGLPAQPDPVVGLPALPDPVVGLPAQPDPVVGMPVMPEQPVVGLRLPDSELVVGLPALQDQPVVGMPLMPDQPVVGMPVMPDQPVVGMPAPKRVLGLPAPRRVLGLPAQ